MEVDRRRREYDTRILLSCVIHASGAIIVYRAQNVVPFEIIKNHRTWTKTMCETVSA